MRPNSSGAAVARAGAVAALLTGSSALAQGLVGPPAPAPLTVAAPASAPPPPLAPAGSLGLAEVLASARFHAPQVLEALARVRGAQGRQLSAQAAFDTVFAVDAASRVTGFYDGTYAEATVTRPFRGIGGYAYGGYRIAGGEFPIYEDERYTNRFGEVKAGAVLSLLRDRIIDERRFGLVQAEIDIALAETDRTLIAIGVQTRAIQSYNNWVVAGLRLAIHRELLALAQQRQAGFRRQVETGARPSILLVENEQNILRRQSLVVQSEQALAQAATSLSLYLRDADGAPLVPSSERLPCQLPPPIRVSAEAATLLARRPDVRVLSLRIDAANRRLTLDRNALLPKLDLKLEASQDIGPVPAQSTSKSSTDTKIGISFSLPLERRAARGRLAQTRADIEANQQRVRFLADQIATDVANLQTAAENAARLAQLARDEAERAGTMAAAERRRFALGTADFFLVNQREEAAADAAVRRLDAAFRQVAANAELAAATADLESLGL
jgi:outer membrane protein TolC